MKTYASTFISGLEKPIKKLLKQNIIDAKIDLILDGIIIYKTNSSIQKIKNLKFFNNSFLLIKSFKNTNSIEQALNKISKIKNLEKEIAKILTNKNKSFRIFTSLENKFISVNKTLLKKIEKRIMNLRKEQLKINLKNPQLEFWILKRRENISFFMLRITKNKQNKNLKKGELRKELSHILCFLSEPKENDTFLDPFAGYGSIPIKRAKLKKVNLIFASDKIKNYKNEFNKRIQDKKLRDKIIPKTLDATNLEFFKDNFITKIVTDPPWGEYKKIKKDFYENFLKEFIRITKQNSIIIILTSKKQEFEKLINKFPQLKLKEKYDILVSGKKSGVFKIIRK